MRLLAAALVLLCACCHGQDLRTREGVCSYVRTHAGDRTTAALAFSAYRTIRGHVRAGGNGNPRASVHDPRVLINTYGVGLCDDQAHALATVWRWLGIESRVWDLSWHVVPEYEDNGWHMLDPMLGMMGEDRASGRVLSVREIQAAPDKLRFAIDCYGDAAVLGQYRAQYAASRSSATLCARREP